MSFRIIGDEIEYEFRLFAKILMPEFATLRACAEEEIEAYDPAKREAEDKEWREGVESAHADEIAELEMKVSDLETENERMVKLLDAIDDGLTALEIIENCRKETAEWRKIAEDNRAAYLALKAPKPRKRRVSVQS